MKLRTALKIVRAVHGDRLKDQRKWMRSRWRRHQIVKARRICRRGHRWLNDDRIPFIPSDSELEMIADFMWDFLGGLTERLLKGPVVP